MNDEKYLTTLDSITCGAFNPKPRNFFATLIFERLKQERCLLKDFNLAMIMRLE